MNSSSGKITDNLARVRDRIERAASRAGRRSEEITLVAVSKTHSARRIQELYEACVRHFGENRVQERESKLAPLSGVDATWHMIGHLQKNKAARAAGLFHSIDSVDSIALAEKLERAKIDLTAENTETGKTSNESKIFTPENRIRILIEIKLDPEPAKSGIDAKDAPRLIESISQLTHLELRGLMGVPPYSDDPEQARPYFRKLRELHDALCAKTEPGMFPVLSMGMSLDFEIAIEEGATELRIGTALFGERGEA